MPNVVPLFPRDRDRFSDLIAHARVKAAETELTADADEFAGYLAGMVDGAKAFGTDSFGSLEILMRDQRDDFAQGYGLALAHIEFASG
ncbi:hypothetical protein [Agrobacterium tumefaciens]|uniref:hypothetical protein n=1 Tax=Agrobacterium tumefaciens TaxID=358 RepID=UPI001573E482|nr:hypothetical protein [Agrobacterium tumefaciens]